tara:strand:+ start:593 stop:1045 length:453 start_codon:yes stop_codon:yes gene_type:complete
MFKFSITLFTILTLIRGIPNPPRTTLQWNQNIFGNWTKVNKVEKHSLNLISDKTIHCGLKNQKQKRFIQPTHRMKSMIQHLYSLNEMRINGLITNREYNRAKSHTLKKWNRCSTQKTNHVGNSVHLLTAIHKNNGLNEREYIRLKKSLLR